MRKKYHQYRTSAFTENRALCGAEGFEDDTPWPESQAPFMRGNRHTEKVRILLVQS